MANKVGKGIMVAVWLMVASAAYAKDLAAPAPASKAKAQALEMVAPAAMPQGLSIVAVVNDDVISSLDLDARINLIMGTTGRPNTPAMREKMTKQVLQLLVDEQLKKQEAKRYNILVERDDVEGAVSRIERSQGKPAGSMEGFIKQKGLSVSSFHDQVESEVAWNKLLARKAKGEVKLTDDEIYRAQQRMAHGKKVKELQIASIILPIVAGMDELEIIGIARDIRSQLQGGVDPKMLLARYKARLPLEFGPMTWVPRDQINPDIAQALENVQAGQISEPVKTPSGYQIIRLLDERMVSTTPDTNAEVALKQIVLKLTEGSSDQEINAMMTIGRSIAKAPGTCMEQGVAGMESVEGLDMEVNYIRTTLTNMSPDVRHMVEPLSVTEITEPFAAPNGIHLLMLCERIDMPMPLPDKEEVRQVLFQEKIELEAEKYLRTLRREAFIDLRV